MKKISILIASIFFVISLKAQLINVNPDKNGEPWYIGGLRIPSYEELNSIPVLKIKDLAVLKTLPVSLDNSELQYFRPIFNQQDGSCAQASGIAYNFTYEMNRKNNTSASLSQNQFPSHFTYNFLNGGSGSIGSWYSDGWNIISANGCPNVQNYGGLWMPDDYYSNLWASGYDLYIGGMQNRVDEQFAIDVSTSDGLLVLKQWMFDHLEGAPTGGIVNFSAGISVGNYYMDGDIITSWGSPVNHAMTIVGWDDNIEYDFNNDGTFTNNIDLNGDDVIDMRDWEKGAVIMVNSWGEYWGNNGKAYIPYRLLAESIENGGIFSNRVFSINVKDEYSPLLVLKTKISHTSREKISVKAGISTNLNATTPDYIIDFPIFNYQGGDLPMNGSNSTPVELALDITPLLSYFESGEDVKIFLGVYENDPDNYYSGNIVELKVKDIEQNIEFSSTSSNVNIANNTVTWISVETNIDFDAPQISTDFFEVGMYGEDFSHQLEATGGEPPYKFNLLIDYIEGSLTSTFPLITSTVIVPDNSDDGTAEINLGFDFPFYGKKYNKLYVNTDGSIIFQPEFDYIRTQEQIIQNKIIAVFASDLMYYPEDGDAIYFQSTSEYAVIRWKSSLFDQQDANIDVALKLYSDGQIEFFYGSNITNDLEWQAAVSNGDKVNYSFFSNSGIGNPENSEFKFIPDDFPVGMEVSEDGLFHGIVPLDHTWDINFLVTDNRNISKSKIIQFQSVHDGIFENLNLNSVICYPNPFSGEVYFGFILDTAENTTLEIYDLSGKRVDLLINNQTLNAGKYNINWNTAVSFEKGIYILKLTTGNKIQTEKVIKY